MKRVILDRSIFHGDKFKALKESALSAAVARGSISLLYTSMFLEETLMFAFHQPDKFLEQWYFIASLNDKLWFVPSDRIVPIELGHKAHRDDYYLMTSKAIRKIILDAPRVPLQKSIRAKTPSWTIRSGSGFVDRESNGGRIP